LSYLEDMSNIDDKTRISLFAVVAVVPFLIGGVAWLTSIDAKATQARDELQGLRPLAIDIRERQIRLEQMVTDLKNHEGRNK
jgi:hypothetical protein